ncbi:glycosyltransferase family 2 protein [bacterium]|nr:glycosyltransferase family 2 protein [bacterium]
MTPKVSICIPTYNRKDFLRETLDSIFAQTYKDYEVVVVDDGSTDGTTDLIKNAGFKNLRYHWQENQGESAARNKLVELAKGRYLTFIDSDDLLFPYAIEELVKIVETHGPDTIAYSSYVGIDDKGNKVKRKHRNLPSGNIAVDLFEHIYVHSCGTLCTKKLLQEANGFDVSLPVCSPYVVWLKLSLKYKFVALERPTFKRRRHSGNLSERSFANQKIEFDVLEDFYYNSGGKEVIQRRRAMRRLSKEGYRAGRCALRERLPSIACQMLSQSFYRYPNFKSLLWWMIATGTGFLIGNERVLG